MMKFLMKSRRDIPRQQKRRRWTMLRPCMRGAGRHPARGTSPVPSEHCILNNNAMQPPRCPARAALQGCELLPRTRGGGVAGVDYLDEHEAFAASRSSDYVYAPSDDAAFGVLDGHAETIEGDIKLPLVVTGPAGCGKSALLANWVEHRRMRKHRDEFLFQHFVGCSPRSKQLAHLLHRLETALKEHFQLREMEVPTSEERLRWSLNRFLAAAAKKQFPARIVVVMDAVNRLKGESSAADTLHWLPTELPHGVRIIVSTVELEQNGFQTGGSAGEGESRVHRTYTELRRRKCPTIRLQPLSVETRHQIIGNFLHVNQQALQSLEQAQQFRLVTAKASSQPLFLRTILYALRLGFELSDATVDEQIDTYLAAETSAQLIAHVLQLCGEYIRVALVPVSRGAVEHHGNAKVLESIMTALFASRHGLCEEELWGIVELSNGDSLPLEQRECIRRVLRDYTFSVRSLRNFSHEDYALVVYKEYICSPEVHVRMHQPMARYFSRLPPCDRKLDALPYHLEVGGSWSKLRAALVDVQMFRLWWMPAHKTEFLNLWASLTARSNGGMPIRKLVTGEFNHTMRCAQSPRPCLDIVEEYVRSVDDFKFVHAPSDDELANTILRIADFMLEFATLSLEEAADVPQFLHPTIPNEDLASLGVPFVSLDKDGNSVLNTPFVEAHSEILSPGNIFISADTPIKINEEIPFCSTYFYHRWMWIQFPWVSLANCGERFLKGLANPGFQKQNRPTICSPNLPGAPFLRNSPGHCNLPSEDCTAVEAKLPDVHADGSRRVESMRCQKTELFSKKPEVRYVQENHLLKPRVDHFAVQVKQLRARIGSFRSELDQLRQERISLFRTHSRARDELSELSKMHLSTSDLELKLSRLAKCLERTLRGHKMARLLYKNYESVKLMCERHPAHSQALIDELEAKLTQDTLFIEDVQQRLLETTFESHNFTANNKVLHHAAQEMTLLQNDMLIQRVRQRQHLQSMSMKEQELSQSRASRGTARVHVSPGDERKAQLGAMQRTRGAELCSKHSAYQDDFPCGADLDSHTSKLRTLLDWELHMGLIRERTFIASIGDFFLKFYNAQSLQTQMGALHQAAEGRQRELKQALSAIELELEQARYDSQSIVGSGSHKARELQGQLTAQMVRCKHARETAIAAERLHQAAFGGVKHVCASLGIPPPDQDTPVSEIIHQIESVMEALMEEKDKNSQKLGEMHGSRFQDNSSGYENLMRTPELDAALEQFEMQKSLIPHRLLAKFPSEARSRHDDLCPMDEGGRLFINQCNLSELGTVVTRLEVKREAKKNARVVQRKLARLIS